MFRLEKVGLRDFLNVVEREYRLCTSDVKKYVAFLDLEILVLIAMRRLRQRPGTEQSFPANQTIVVIFKAGEEKLFLPPAILHIIT